MKNLNNLDDIKAAFPAPWKNHYPSMRRMELRLDPYGFSPVNLMIHNPADKSFSVKIWSQEDTSLDDHRLVGSGITDMSVRICYVIALAIMHFRSGVDLNKIPDWAKAETARQLRFQEARIRDAALLLEQSSQG